MDAPVTHPTRIAELDREKGRNQIRHWPRILRCDTPKNTAGARLVAPGLPLGHGRYAAAPTSPFAEMLLDRQRNPWSSYRTCTETDPPGTYGYHHRYKPGADEL
jgi:hypothetical protein